MDYSYILNCIRMDIYADRVTCNQSGLGTMNFTAWRGGQRFDWNVSAMDMELGASYAINSAVDAFRRKFKQVGV